MKNKGITLIALIITIIVLLILAAVSIAILTGDNGIITKAIESREKTEIAEVIERARVDILGVQAGNSGNITNAQLQSILTKYFNDVPETLPEDLSTLVLTTKDEYGKHEIEISKIYNGTTTEGNKSILLSARDIANSEDKSKYYGAAVTGYTCTNSAGVSAWKLFYADENNIYLISDYIFSPYAPKGRGGTSLNLGSHDNQFYFADVISDYTGSSDITDARIKALNNDYFIKGYTSSNQNMKAIAYMLDINVWNVFAGDKAEYAIGGPTIELFFKSYNERYHTDYKAKATDTNGYQISKDGGENWYYWYASMITTEEDSLYHATDYKDGMLPFPYSYWIASPIDKLSNDSGEEVSILSKNGDFATFNYGTNGSIGLRPVVCLKSNVQLEQQGNGTYAIK